MPKMGTVRSKWPGEGLPFGVVASNRFGGLVSYEIDPREIPAGPPLKGRRVLDPSSRMQLPAVLGHNSLLIYGSWNSIVDNPEADKLSQQFAFPQSKKVAQSRTITSTDEKTI